MKIKEIKLNNFRIYYGSNTLSFQTSTDKNIVVVSGKNGFGKTTLLMALVWCLYGRQMINVDAAYKKEIEDQGGYAKYIDSSLNRLARECGDTSFSVSMTLTDVKVPEMTCDEMQIIRSRNSNLNEEKLKILIDGHDNELIRELSTGDNDDGEEIFIRDYILPIEIAKFFLFDAEKIVSLAELNSPDQRKQLSKAYTEVLGIRKYQDLKEQLEMLQDDYRKKGASTKEKTEIVNNEASLKTENIKIDDINKLIKQLDSEKIEKKAESDAIQVKLIQAGASISIEELEAMKQEEEELDRKLSQLNENLRELYELIPFGLAGDLMISASNQLELERNRLEVSVDQHSLNQKISLLLDDLEMEKKKLSEVIPTPIRLFYDEKIRILIEKHFGRLEEVSPDNFKPLHDFNATQINEFNALINDVRTTLKHRFEKLSKERELEKQKLSQIRRKINDAEKATEDEYIADLKGKKQLLDSRVREIEHLIASEYENIGACKLKIQALKQGQEMIRKKLDAEASYSENEKKTHDLIEKLKIFIKEFKSQKKKSLEENIYTELNHLLHKRDFISAVNVSISPDGEDVDINLIDKRGKPIQKTSLSMGERQMYASCLLKALIEESDIQFPVFIDSPLQKLDVDHANAIIDDFYPELSEQVIILPLMHSEISAEQYNRITGKIGTAYLIDNVNEDISSFLPVEPSKLITVYAERRNAD